MKTASGNPRVTTSIAQSERLLIESYGARLPLRNNVGGLTDSTSQLILENFAAVMLVEYEPLSVWADGIVFIGPSREQYLLGDVRPVSADFWTLLQEALSLHAFSKMQHFNADFSPNHFVVLHKQTLTNTEHVDLTDTRESYTKVNKSEVVPLLCLAEDESILAVNSRKI
ncbi:hypothetical protein CAPTEDRAFT_187105 [Capitella teleta]|uniref:Uncharacterized protein n=1 Tax=Capitella teleta TaxID=283909 RepID=R7VH59_CAPTE|nr:hypothetical protein CAPTEDRAFT_187105 [Capitella teleta]|eukprot:ELU15631.1 hypothetical protein CAPTEDRAFT_187105 [Capitella teleta]